MVSLQGHTGDDNDELKNSDHDAIDLLDDAALEVGGWRREGRGCIPGRPLPKPPFPTGDWTFKDVFARWTIG